jgi:NAD(P)-dependent dehydrogenase (short-subunit alcohol dehydrogenase family)
MQVSLAGKVAVVTGASSGIGLAVTKAYLEADAAGVIAVFRRPDFPNELTDCQTRYGKKLIVVNGDVAEEATAQDFTRAAVDHFGRLDLVVSNAAVSVVKALHEHTSEEWDT